MKVTRNHKKLWTDEQKKILQESYGQTSMMYMMKAIGKSEDAIKQMADQLLGTHDLYIAGGMFSAPEVADALGVDHRTIIDWIHTRNFPAMRFCQRPQQDKSYRFFIDPSRVWNWVAKNKERINFAQVKLGVLLPEPDWLGEEIIKAVDKGVKRPTNWTDYEDEIAWFWYKGGMNYREIAKRLRRPEKGTQKRLTIIRKRKEKELVGS